MLARLLIGVLGLAGCGRVGFDVEARIGDAPTDTSAIDVAPDAAIPLAGLVAHFAFEDVATDGVDNRASMGASAVCVTSCPPVVPGKRGLGYRFNGISDSLRLPDHPSLHSPAGTVAAWVRLSGLPPMDEYMVFASKAFGTSLENTWEIFLTRGASLFIAGGGDAASDDRYASTDWTLGTGTWVHLALTWDADIRLYINGVLGPTIGSAGRTYDTGDVYIGSDFDSGALTAYLAGDLDEVMIFSIELTAAQIAALAAP